MADSVGVSAERKQEAVQSHVNEEKEKDYESYRCYGETARLLQSADELGICCGNPVATKLWDSSHSRF